MNWYNQRVYVITKKRTYVHDPGFCEQIAKVNRYAEIWVNGSVLSGWNLSKPQWHRFDNQTDMFEPADPPKKLVQFARMYELLK